MEIILEILIQAFWFLFQCIGELLIQAFGELIAELIGRTVKEPFRRPEPVHPLLAGIGYAIFGAAIGGISLWLLPSLFITAEWLRTVNLIVSPLLGGFMMERLGAWREKKGKKTIRLDSFGYGFIFAFSMALVRFTWGH